ncbi:type I secretion C-terminal target domain-containing protein [Endozoicomonas sp. Mp262]|uniref:type I secretion C-terminal target domain-containing protein n=1 Tax=Endozoicomonas sp. Mp262 TaxID=2919499 RepID=UPI0021DFAF6D
MRLSPNGFNVYISDGSLYVGAWSEANSWDGTFIETSLDNLDAGWHSVTMVLDASGTTASERTVTGYLDGVDFGSQSSAVPVSAHSGAIAFGGVNGETKIHTGDSVSTTNYYFQGEVDEASLYNRALSNAEVKVLSNYDNTLTEIFNYTVNNGIHETTASLTVDVASPDTVDTGAANVSRGSVWTEISGSHLGFDGETSDWINNNTLEVSSSVSTYGLDGLNNGNFVELDGPTGGSADQLSLPVDTSSEQSFIVEFSLAQRIGGTSTPESSAIDIIWGGEVISRVTPQGGDWNRYRIALPAKDGVVSTDLILREVINDGLGSMLDDIRVYEMDSALGEPITVSLAASMNTMGETLTYEISDVPVGGSISAAVGDTGATVVQDSADPTIWRITSSSDLSGFVFTPAGDDAGMERLRIEAYSTDSEDGRNQVVSQDVSIMISPEGTVNITDSGSGPTLLGDTEDNLLLATSGNDILTGGSGADMFTWRNDVKGTSASAGNDTISDFNISEGDVLDIRDLLVDEENNDLTQYLSFDQTDASNPILEIRDTADGDITQKVTLQGVDLSSLGSTDAEIINSLLNNGNLNTDQ